VVPTLRLCVLYGSQNKQQLLPYKTLTDWFLYPKWRVFTARYALSPYTKQIRFVFKGLRNTNFHMFKCFWLVSPRSSKPNTPVLLSAISKMERKLAYHTTMRSVCVCVCVCARARARARILVYAYTYLSFQLFYDLTSFYQTYCESYAIGGHFKAVMYNFV
jgi:hypothetical protein